MPEQHTIDIDLRRDLVTFFRTELVRLGYNVVDVTDDHELVCGYFGVCRRLIALEPRHILKSKNFSCILEHCNALAEIEQLILDGGDISPYLSRKIKKFNYNDLFLNDWGIHHLHLGTEIDPDGFINRTDPLLYCRFEEDYAYFIDILPHGNWTSKKLITTMHDNWPELLSCFFDGVTETETRLSDEEIKELRRKRINYFITMNDGTTYSLLGGGSTFAETNIYDVMRTNQYLGEVNRKQQEIIADFPEIENRARERGISFGEPPWFELRFIGETFCAVESYSGYNLPLSYP